MSCRAGVVWGGRLLDGANTAITFEHIVCRAAISGDDRRLGRRARAGRALQAEAWGTAVTRHGRGLGNDASRSPQTAAIRTSVGHVRRLRARLGAGPPDERIPIRAAQFFNANRRRSGYADVAGRLLILLLFPAFK